MDGWMDRWMDRWIDGWMDGWIGRDPSVIQRPCKVPLQHRYAQRSAEASGGVYVESSLFHKIKNIYQKSIKPCDTHVCVVLSCLVLSCVVLFCVVLSCLVLCCFVLCCLVLCCFVL